MEKLFNTIFSLDLRDPDHLRKIESVNVALQLGSVCSDDFDSYSNYLDSFKLFNLAEFSTLYIGEEPFVYLNKFMNISDVDSNDLKKMYELYSQNRFNQNLFHGDLKQKEFDMDELKNGLALFETYRAQMIGLDHSLYSQFNEQFSSNLETELSNLL